MQTNMEKYYIEIVILFLERNNYNASDWSGSFYLAPPANSTSLTSYQIIGIVAGLVLVISIIFLVVVGIIIYNCSNGKCETVFKEV